MQVSYGKLTVKDR